MDNTTQSLVEFIHGLSLDQLNEDCLDAVKMRVMDTLACAWGGFDAEPVVISKKALLRPACSGVAHVLGGESASVDVAAFINSFMARYLDYNDGFAPAVGVGHPSEMILPLFNVAEETSSSGSDLILAIAVAYQVNLAINGGAKLVQNHWFDAAFASAMGTAAGASVLMSLSPAATAHAVTLAVATTTPLFSRKTCGEGGEISMWKGGAGPQACRTGVLSALLAREGMTGPNYVFEGAGGVWEKFTGKFDVNQYLDIDDYSAVEETWYKLFPTAGVLQALLATTLELRNLMSDADRIEHIDVDVNAFSIRTVVQPEAWEIKTREAADHSLPFTVAALLLDGAITRASFNAGALERRDIRNLMSRITVKENANFTTRFPEEDVGEIAIHLHSGRSLRKQASGPWLSPKDPGIRDALRPKLHTLMEPRLGAENLGRLGDRVQSLEDWASVSEIFGTHL